MLEDRNFTQDEIVDCDLHVILKSILRSCRDQQGVSGGMYMILFFTFLLCKTIRDNYDLESQFITKAKVSLGVMTTFKK